MLQERARDIAKRTRSRSGPHLISEVDTNAAELSGQLAEYVAPPGASAVAVIDGLSVADAPPEPTPTHWTKAGTHTSEFDVAMLLLARCAGTPFGWQGQQAGRLVANVVPVSGHEGEQTGQSSATLLNPHTEDAFHPRRAHLLLLGCLRNPDRVATTVASVRHTLLSPADRRLLGEPMLPILPDTSYDAAAAPACAPAVSTLWDGPDGLTARYDPSYTPLERADGEFRCAYDRLGAELKRVCIGVPLQPGQLLLIDNDTAVHGREPFRARYDGTDRWLKRVNVALPERVRNPAEVGESGYGQGLVEPFGAPPSTRNRGLQ